MPKRKTTPLPDLIACRECGGTIHHQPTPGEPPPDVCGKTWCQAHANWTTTEWEGRARMATARQHAGAFLDRLDREALSRCPTP